MTPENAKKMVLENLNYLDGLCRKRFQYNATLGEMVQCYLLGKLQENEWNRIRSFKGNSQFLTYLTVVVNRLLTQFERQECGYPRPPSSLPDTPLAKKAFWLLRIKKWSKQEVIEILECMDDSFERSEIEEIIHAILSQKQQIRFNNQFESVEDVESMAISNNSPEDIMLDQELQDLKTMVKSYLSSQDDECLPEQIQENAKQLSNQLNLSDEDWLFIRMYFVDNLSIKEIAKRLRLKGDAHKRYHKILNQLQKAFRQTDLWEAFAT
jgi:RNA polymerase sigma factor (sigma-70 family)